ncbi:MAG: hypothetical protein JNL72_04015 [Flavipsychrobacter sp.]|nr:hypothetical protein [Flavipsychrobacter sp.]
MNHQPLLRLFTAATILFCTTSAVAQECRYVKTVTDPFTKVVSRGAKMAIGDPFAMREVLFEESEGKLYFGLRIVFSDMEDIPFLKGDKVSMMLASDELIEISPAKDVPSQVFKIDNLSLRQWIVMQEVPVGLYEKISASPITAIKFHLKNDYMVKGIKERQVQKIMENAACMLKTR